MAARLCGTVQGLPRRQAYTVLLRHCAAQRADESFHRRQPRQPGTGWAVFAASQSVAAEVQPERLESQLQRIQLLDASSGRQATEAELREISAATFQVQLQP